MRDYIFVDAQKILNFSGLLAIMSFLVFIIATIVAQKPLALLFYQ